MFVNRECWRDGDDSIGLLYVENSFFMCVMDKALSMIQIDPRT